MGLEESARLVIGSLPTLSGGLLLVCIEGFMGAGKPALAEAVADCSPTPATVVHADELYAPETRDWRSWTPSEGYQASFDHRRLEAEVIRPLRGGHSASFQRYDWVNQEMDGLVEIRPEGLIVVEGVYLLRERLRRYWDFSVFVDTPRDLRRVRSYARGESEEGWLAQWMRAENHYEQVEDPVTAADLMVSGY